MKQPFPTKNQLLQACRGEAVHDHPLLRWARQLTDLHERKRTLHHDQHDDIDRERTELIHEINRWITAQLPPSHGAAMVHTETVGSVIDRLAQLTSSAYAALTSGCEWDLRDRWEQLAELAIGYEDLATDVTLGRRRLPGGH
ncbi:DUF4254 domain-containing protein [Nocardia amamiensis]|uniref:DUF4254 domain-containing protein n=1 Tax=Nocardia amamiensis TaxID=404578 RepID=UPI00082BF9AC|nr:DUF4254 domain-containing protein [Nocardia amamiensis]